ncbi:potassium channel family protein [Peribacillus sp. SCS-37]|uniref:potassium channel family protein n=1 Tax=Paraperibacillus esterisolvens TaxID=3115296 RepID=UPI00390637B5
MNPAKKEFTKKNLVLYLVLNIFLAALLVVNPVFLRDKEEWNYVMLTFLLFLLVYGIYLLYRFIALIPAAKFSLARLCFGCVLLLGMIILVYANLYLQVYMRDGRAFTGRSLNGDDFLYFSITTFTTTGYGDITAVGPISKAFAASEMLLGFVSNAIFMTILAAKLVTRLK